MKGKYKRIFIYILFLLVSCLFYSNISELIKGIERKNFSNVFTTSDVDSLLGNNVAARNSVFKVNEEVEDIELASATNLDVQVQGDLVSLNYYYAADFYINTVRSYSSSISVTKYNGVKSGSNAYISLKNGTYFFYSYSVNDMKLVASPTVQVSKSCNNETKSNQTGTFTVERCYIKNSNGSVTADSSGTIGTCANGYTMGGKSIVSNGCDSISMVHGLQRRYCKVVVQATCTNNSNPGGNPNPTPNPNPNPNPNPTPTPNPNPGGGVAAPKLDSLYIDSGVSISPAFKPTIYNYAANVDASVSSISINGDTAGGTSFVSGEGPRTVKLNYGNNVVRVKVKNSQGKTVTYTVNITRADGRSTVNTLSRLSVDVGTLDPPFTSTDKEYKVKVPAETEKITIDAMLTDNKSSFLPDAGPGTYDLIDGPNKLYLKVVSESGLTNIYTIVVERETIPTECTTNAEEYGLLKEIVLSSDADVEIDPIEDFDPKTFQYADIKIPFKVSNLTVNAYAQDDADKENIEITGAEGLEVNVPRTITIKIKSSKCTNIVNEYTLEVTRQPEKTKGNNPELENLEIKGYDIDYSREKLAYGIKLKKSDDKLDITPKPIESTTKCTISGNEDLKMGSVVTVKCVAEDEEVDPAIYTISIDGVEKGTNVFVIILVVVGIIILLVYLLLKLLGYKIVFNTGVIGAFFRGIKEKFNNMFDK